MRLCTSTAGVMGLISAQRAKIPHAAQCSQKKKNGLQEPQRWVLGAGVRFRKAGAKPYVLRSPHRFQLLQPPSPQWRLGLACKPAPRKLLLFEAGGTSCFSGHVGQRDDAQSRTLPPSPGLLGAMLARLGRKGHLPPSFMGL